MKIRDVDRTVWCDLTRVIFPSIEALDMPGTRIEGIKEHGRVAAVIANKAINKMMVNNR